MVVHDRRYPRSRPLNKILEIFFTTKGARPFQVLTCLSIAGLAQGLGIASLLPIISLVLGDGGEPENPTIQAFYEWFAFFGIEVNVVTLLTFGVAAVVAKNVLNLAAMTYVGFTVAKIATDFRLALVRNLLTVRWSYFTDQPLGKTTNALGGEVGGASQAYLTAAAFLAGVIRAMVYLIVAFFVSWQIALVAILAGGMIAGALSFLVRMSRRAGNSHTKHMRRLIIYLSDTLNNIKPLKAMDRQKDFAELLDSIIFKLRKAIRKGTLASQALTNANEVLGTTAVALGFGFGIVYFEFPPADLVVMGLLLNQLLKTVQKLQSQYQKAVAFQRPYYNIIEQIAETEEKQETDLSEKLPEFDREIAFENVSFSHPGTPVLENLSLQFKKHDISLLTGPSGSGKTTITDLVLGFYAPDSGQVLIDGRPLQDFSLRAWRASIGYVPQEPILFRDTIFTNIALGNKALSEEDVKDALRIAGAVEFVEKMPKGILSEVGEKGAMMSGGQRQRIAIARALVCKPRLLILDEVTSALDPETEQAIVQNIRGLKGKVTVIAITHRPAFLNIADRVYHLEGGQVVSTEADLELEA